MGRRFEPDGAYIRKMTPISGVIFLIWCRRAEPTGSMGPHAPVTGDSNESTVRAVGTDGAYGKRSPLVGGRFACSSWREPTGPPVTRAVTTHRVVRVALGVGAPRAGYRRFERIDGPCRRDEPDGAHGAPWCSHHNGLFGPKATNSLGTRFSGLGGHRRRRVLRTTTIRLFDNRKSR